MTTMPMTNARFEPGSVVTLDEPVRRYLTHALLPGAALTTDVRLRMTGRIKIGAWLRFTAEQDFHALEFEWRARAGLGAVNPLHVVDRYAAGAGTMTGKLFDRFTFLHATDANTTRAAAGRGAAESIWVPASLLPDQGVSWRAENDDVIVASFAAPPEHPDLRLRIDEHGAPRSVSIERWGHLGQKAFGYMPFGGDISAERRFGDTVLPSQLTVGWWYGTPRYKPFFTATITDAIPLAGA